MASNVRNGNTFYVTTSSTSADSSSYISTQNLKLVGIMLEVSNSTDAVDIYDKNPGQAAAGNQKLKLKLSTAGNQAQFRFDGQEIVFPNGVWVTLTGSPILTLVFTQSTGS